MRRFEVLSRIAQVSDRGGSLHEALDSICEIIVPEFADFCMIDLITRAAGSSGSRCGSAPGGGRSGRARPAPSAVPRSPANARRVRRSASLDAALLRADDRRRPARPRPRRARTSSSCAASSVSSAITVALKARGRLTGALTLGVAWSGRRYAREDAHFAGSSPAGSRWRSRTPASSPTSSGPKRRAREIAETLQRGLLPPPLPHIPGWSVAACYRPAGAENEVGGDFYDAFRVAGGWMLVIGDVTGRGAARRLDHRLRPATRCAPPAALTGDPLVALATLNRALLARGDSALCSVAALALSEDPLQPVRIAVAGHPPPLLVDGEAVTEVAGAGPGPRRLHRRRVGDRPARSLEPGQQLVIVTDGITEARGQRRPLRRGAPARGAGRRRRARRRPCSASKRPCSLHRAAGTTTTSRSSPWRRTRRVAAGGLSLASRRAGRRRGGIGGGDG